MPQEQQQASESRAYGLVPRTRPADIQFYETETICSVQYSAHDVLRLFAKQLADDAINHEHKVPRILKSKETVSFAGRAMSAIVLWEG